ESLAGECDCVESFGEFALRLGVKGIADVPECFGLLGGGIDQCGMAVAEDSSAESGEEVDVTFACGIPQQRAFAAGHDDGQARVVSNQNIFSSLDDRCHVRHFLCLRLSSKARWASIHRCKDKSMHFEGQAYATA